MIKQAILKVFFICVLILFSQGCANVSRQQVTGKFYPNEPENRNKRVFVFVHGIDGDAYKTWLNDNSGKYFFELVQEDVSGAGKDSDIFIFGYPSKLSGNASTTISEAAIKLRDRLNFNKITDYQQIIFVAHSMGGLITIKYLLDNSDIFPKVPLVLSFGTPYLGSKSANWGKLISDNPNLIAMHQPKNGINEFSKELKRKWEDSSNKVRPKLRCAYEKDTFLGEYIVEEKSAIALCNVSDSDGIGADHFYLVKPADKDTDAYFFLSSGVESVPLPRNAIVYLEGVGSTSSVVSEITVSVKHLNIKEAVVYFYTTKNNDDNNIWVSSEISCDGIRVAKYTDDLLFNKNTTIGPLQLYVQDTELRNNRNCRIIIRTPKKAHFTWNFDARFIITFTDGAKREYNFENIQLNKTKNEVTKALDFQF